MDVLGEIRFVVISSSRSLLREGINCEMVVMVDILSIVLSGTGRLVRGSGLDAGAPFRFQIRGDSRPCSLGLPFRGGDRIVVDEGRDE